jgi:hypothetical protein
MKPQTHHKRMVKYRLNFANIVSRLASLSACANPDVLEAAERGLEALDTATICVEECECHSNRSSK